MTAATAVPGIPRVSAGIIADAVSALFAHSEAATPSGSPLPHVSGVLLTRRASLYDKKAAIEPPAPGRMPIQIPMSDDRIQVFQYRSILGTARKKLSVRSRSPDAPAAASGVSRRSITGGKA